LGEDLVSHADDHAGTGEGTRRDFLYYATAGAGVVATGAAVWPLVNQMNPSADTRALASIMVDVSGVEVGTQLTVKWRGKPVFIRRRSPEEIEAARAVKLDRAGRPMARTRTSPTADASDANRTLDEAGEWLVMMGVCTHLGCVPLGDGAGEFGGWFCPCHGSHYDTAGRIRKGPAPRNLEVPVARSSTKPPSSWAEDQHHGRNPARPLRAQDRAERWLHKPPADRRAVYDTLMIPTPRT
jgi:ubiquinol-cytochrome c reductase iron-sulfur subunit